MMRKRMLLPAVLLLLLPACFSASSIAETGIDDLSDESAGIDPAALRRNLIASVGVSPWNSTDGYRLDGRFVLKATGEEIAYTAAFTRSAGRWAADYSQENRTRNMRYVSAGDYTWVASPEITEDIEPERLPYTARFDVHQLYEDLLRILEEGSKNPSFAISVAGRELYVSGTLHNGWHAAFVLTTAEYFPRKVFITTAGQPSAAWLIPFAQPQGHSLLKAVPGPATEFELWLSDPVPDPHALKGYRYARRMDFMEQGIVVGTFFLDETSPAADPETLFARPARFPWLASVRFAPRADSLRPSFYLTESERSDLRARAQHAPWSGWAQNNRRAARWAAMTLWTGKLFPKPPSPLALTLSVGIGFLGFIVLLMRRRLQSTQRRFSWRLLAAGFFLACMILLAGLAAWQLHHPRIRSLLALHSSLRYTLTGDAFHIATADSLLTDFTRKAPAQTLEDAGHSAQAYALAYDLIRRKLPPARREQVEKSLFDYAMPLFGASRGWVSTTEISGVLASGLGMVGMAIGCEPFVEAARDTMDSVLGTQFDDGLHRSGPGPGIMAMDSAVNLFYGLKHSGRVNYYRKEAFKHYMQTTLLSLSPVGTAPLFGSTNLDHSARLSLLFMKAANHLPETAGRRCVAAYNLFQAYGRHQSGKWIRPVLPALQPMLSFFENPYVLLHYARPLPELPLQASSGVFGDGRMAVLRSGAYPDSLYLALNMSGGNPATTHRDILNFDLFAYRGLLLHGPGFPGKNSPDFENTTKTSAANSITMNHQDQPGIHCAGIESYMINQPLFDQIRALADKTYDSGRVQRDIVMVRPEKNYPAYFIILDDVFVSNPATTVQWHLHGRGVLETSIDHRLLWMSTAFNPPRLKKNKVILEIIHPGGISGSISTTSRT
ncbi:MAG TPA: hypothetical protein VLL97_10880, partial [Acidobacteriota bacterium]|nr:hypothetical protein [Acidobacteriota bacterium]